MGRLAWLRAHWRSEQCTPIVSQATAAELQRVLAYPKFSLRPEERIELLGDYLPFCEIVENVQHCPIACRDRGDQPFLDLAFTAGAHALVTGDADLLTLKSSTSFAIVSPENYRQTWAE